MRKAIIPTILSVLTLPAISQITNDGSVFFVQPGAIVYSEDYVLNENNGQYDNSGDIYLEGDWINNGGNTALINSSPGTVIMNGGSQLITGSDVTRFYNLELNGGASIKTMTIDAETENQLDLIDAELQTQDNIMYVTNPNTTAVLWTNGYVASNALGGYLSRATNSISAYQYPVGSSLLSGIYRGVEITPSSASANEYAVRVADIDPSIDNSGTSASGAVGPFDRATKNAQIDNINSNFYHNIIRLSGTDDAAVDVYYFSADGDYESMAQWQSASSQWETTNFANSNTTAGVVFGAPNRISSIASLNNFAHDVFALNNLIRTITIPQFISPNGDGQNDVLDIENLHYYPENKLQVFNRWGNLVFEKDNYQNDWDGTANVDKGVNLLIGGDNPLPSGTYFYILDLGVEGLENYVGYVQIHK